MLTVRSVPRSRVALPAALSSVETVVALTVAHLAAGGQAPEVGWLAAFGAVVYVAGLAVLRRRVTLRVALPALLASQVLGHAWLVTLSQQPHHGHSDAGPVFGLSWSMLAAHLVAAAVTGTVWLLRRRAVTVILQWARPGRLPAPVLRRALGVTALRSQPIHHGLCVTPTRGPPALMPAT
ncbi:hypothetical protein [Nocardioides sp. SYSU DS0651]|uniref:hypothetical protein n=1 Tax=Nocardioides sp. SYSU DS0651 TaxID=3415955 RepID=UPI003F4B6B24